MSPSLIVILVASCVAAACALVGSFLVLRQMALLGDAISHAVLPGIVLAFLFTGERSPLPMILGAGALGVLTVFLVEAFHRTQRLKEDASIGVVFPALFSIGVVLISRFAGQVDLDLDCVLYGEIAYAPLDLLYFQGNSIGPKALWVNGSVLLANILFVVVLYKELKLTTFDAGLAAALGFSPIVLHYALMSMVSMTVVGAFESVGAILVVAMLIVPPATAYLLTDKLSTLLGLAVGFGVLSAVLGYWLAYAWDASIAGAMATVSGALFTLVFLFSPRYGLLARWLRQLHLGRNLSDQLLLLHLHGDDRPQSIDRLARRFSWRGRRLEAVVDRLEQREWIRRVESGIIITPSGELAIEKGGVGPLRHRPAKL
jgi:manganese/zinc/iron transport system permease protein